ncbi:hypothetical protein [Lepagella muris]|uniref:Uncharacterized protein n=1 Tax=Lepagella muris TaxID=3032870 RepID=A0AC61RE91_9BACT|nr:hypothetical protein [Lepagella muris]TGY77874.1 hypothetical protein E5331_12795 [Lepagella muris]THG51329.1 hypothetical protein E5984_12000 [Bacteroidales bacterium]TKC64193.1 hypothetical protein E5359_002495 [Bacteroidales bacterium]
METSKVFLRDMNTGEELEILPGTVEVSWTDKDTHPIDIHHSYKFECSVNLPLMNEVAKELFFGSPGYKTACRLADELNDLIEEYHAPGTPRRERRAIRREFVKIYRIFRKHCKECKINFKFVRPEK